MKVELLIMEEGFHTYMSKGNERKEYKFSGRDCSPVAEGRCANNFWVMATDEQVDKFKGKLVDQKIVVNVKTISMGFNGETKLVGEIEPLKRAA